MKEKETSIPKRKSISGILLTRIVLIVGLILGLTVFTSSSLAKRYIFSISQDALVKETQSYSTKISGWAQSRLATLNTVLNTVRFVNFSDEKSLLSYLATTMSLDEAFPNGVYLGTGSTNKMFDPSGFVPDSDYIIADREWYIDGLQAEAMTFGVPYVDASTGGFLVSASALVDGDTVMASDISLDTISALVQEMKIMDDGYAFLVDTNSDTIIAHADPSYAGQEISQCGSKFIQESCSYLDTPNDAVHEITDNGTRFLVNSSSIDGTSWVLVSCANYDTVFASVFQIGRLLAALSLVMTLISSIILFWFIRRTTAPIAGLTQAIGVMTNGDFTQEIQSRGNNEITTMSEQLKHFSAQMRRTIQELNEVSSTLNTQSVESLDLSNNMSSSAEQQSDSMRQLNETVDELAKSIQEIAENATSLAMTVSDVTQSSNQAKEEMNATVSITSTGRNDIQNVTERMDRINISITNLNDTVREVGESTQEINNITDIIGSIADQTNLLALNASIEAARAGEAGRGFAVVATEIGNLAGMSTDAVGKISTLITKISEEVNAVVTKTQDTVIDISESKDLVDKTYETFGNIYQQISDVSSLIDTVSEQIITVDSVATNMAAITEEQSASTEEILATSENLYEHASRIAEDSHGVHDIAGELEQSAKNINGHITNFTV